MKLNLEQRDAMIAQYMPVAQRIAASKKKCLPTVDIDELRSAAYLGLVEAANRYNADQGEFLRYALSRIIGAVQDYLRSLGFGSKGSTSRGCKSFVSLDKVNTCTGEAFVDALPSRKTIDLRIIFDEITEQLPPQGKNVLWQYFIEGRNLKEIGVGLGLTESRVSQLLSKYKTQIVLAA
jgi:RNA polymerase sigma factor (sigma-70 family)